MNRNFTIAKSTLALTALAGSCATAQPCPVQCAPSQQITICYEAGRVDNFNALTDPTTIRPFYNAFLSTLPPVKPFDSAIVNARFGHTFGKLPCGIVAARLEIKLRAENDIPQNDSLGLQWTGSSFAWGQAIASLPGAGGTWNAGQVQTFNLNLGALPGGGNIIPLLNTTNALDLYTQDDTSVDYAKLTLTICPCDGPYRVYTTGVADNFAPGTDPTWRQPRLTALRTVVPFTWRDSDSCTLDRGWGNTFTGLVGGIVRAQFGIRMKTCGGGSSNDGMAFELLNPGDVTAFEKAYNINLLPGAGSWTANPLTNFFFDLNTQIPTTVCGTNLLGGLLDNMFDVYVQDDTGVDTARLRVQPCPPLRHFWGVPVDAINSAILEHDIPTTRQAYISPPLDGGLAGVSIDAHGSRGQTVHLYGNEFALETPGTVHNMLIEADIDGDGTWEAVNGIKLTKADAGRCTIEPAVGGEPGTCVTMVLHNTVTGESLELCSTPGDAIECSSMDITSFSWGASNPAAPLAAAERTQTAFLKLRDVALHRTSSGITFHGDVVELRSPSSDTTAPVERFSWSWGESNAGMSTMGHRIKSIECDVGPEFSDSSAPLTQCSVSMTGPGGMLNPNPGSFSVSNAAGSRGICTARVMGSDDLALAIEPICAGTPENCDTLVYSISTDYVGSFGGQGGLPAGSSSVRHAQQGFFDIAYDISPVDSNLYRVIVGDRDTMSFEQDSSQGSGQLRAMGTGHISGCGKQGVVIGGVRTACLWWEWNQPMTFLINGQAVTGTMLRVVASDPNTAFDHLESMTLGFEGLEDLDVTSIVSKGLVPPVTCFADFNQDGGIDGADVDAFFAKWSLGESDADVNQDGGVDGADVDEFFIQWSQGGC